MIQRMKSIVQRNFTAKIIALMVAITLWVIVMDDQNPAVDREYTIGVTLDNVPKGYRIAQDAETMKLKVRAQRSYFVNVDSGDFKAKVDLEGMGEGTYRLPIHIQMPQGFEVLEMEPGTVEIVMDPYVENQIKAELIVTGSTAPSVTIAKVQQNYDMVTVIGPKSAVEQVSRVIGYVGLTGNDSDFTLQVPLSAINDQGREVPDVQVVPSLLEVNVQMARGLSKKVVTVRPVLENNLPQGYVVEAVRASPSSIEIAGSDALIGTMDGIATENISLKDHDRTFTAPVKLILPEGITVTNPDVSVNIVINKRKNNK
ncbi:MAG: hypothetical protein IIZ54_03510 [Selenomonadaceae bacterium]|nr:hypothetical protein [Selenomonadaceae bacterium]MBQ3972205.1 hypothetical protein [Selenomonadaceae bacterium]